MTKSVAILGAHLLAKRICNVFQLFLKLNWLRCHIVDLKRVRIGKETPMGE